MNLPLNKGVACNSTLASIVNQCQRQGKHVRPFDISLFVYECEECLRVSFKGLCLLIFKTSNKCMQEVADSWIMQQVISWKATVLVCVEQVYMEV